MNKFVPQKWLANIWVHNNIGSILIMRRGIIEMALVHNVCGHRDELWLRQRGPRLHQVPSTQVQWAQQCVFLAVRAVFSLTRSFV